MVDVDDFLEFAEYLERLEGDDSYHLFHERPSRRYVRDLENPFEKYCNVTFKLRYHFEKETVIEMMHILHIEERVERPDNRGLPIAPVMQLLAVLRFYATGSTKPVLEDLKGINQSTVSRLLHRVTQVIAAQLADFVHFPDAHGLKANRELFANVSGFPGVTGIIDGTHIIMHNPGGPYGETYRNRKRSFSINVQVVCGPRREILDVVARWPGQSHDAEVFDNSRVRRRFETGRLPGCLVGDTGYPLSPYLLTPLLLPATEAEVRYNSTSKSARKIVHGCIGELKGRMRCLQTVLAYSPVKVSAFVCACAILHNIANSMNDPMPVDDRLIFVDGAVPVKQFKQVPDSPGAVFRQAFIARHFQ